MCVVSNMGDIGRTFWPGYPTPAVPYSQPYNEYTFERVPTKEEWAAFMELVRKAAEFDRITGQPDCEDPEKTDWFEAMDRRVQEIAEAVDNLIDDVDDLTDWKKKIQE